MSEIVRVCKKCGEHIAEHMAHICQPSYPTREEILNEINNAVYSAWIAVLTGSEYPITNAAIHETIREAVEKAMLEKKE